MNLDAYFARIGYGGPTAATLATLRALTAAHAQAVPFENLDVLLGRPIRLDLPSLERKLVQQRRGELLRAEHAVRRCAGRTQLHGARSGSAVEQRTTHDVFRLMPGPGGLELQLSAEAGWLPMYRFSGEAQEPADYEMASFYVSNAPDSPFRQHLMMSRAAADARHNLMNNVYRVLTPAAPAREEVVTQPQRLRALIAGELGCDPPESPAFDALLARVCAL